MARPLGPLCCGQAALNISSLYINKPLTNGLCAGIVRVLGSVGCKQIFFHENILYECELLTNITT